MIILVGLVLATMKHSTEPHGIGTHLVPTPPLDRPASRSQWAISVDRFRITAARTVCRATLCLPDPYSSSLHRPHTPPQHAFSRRLTLAPLARNPRRAHRSRAYPGRDGFQRRGLHTATPSAPAQRPILNPANRIAMCNDRDLLQPLVTRDGKEDHHQYRPTQEKDRDEINDASTYPNSFFADPDSRAHH